MASSENNEQQQSSEGFANSCYKIVSRILLEELINDFVICKHCGETLLLSENVTTTRTRTKYFKKEPHFLIDQSRICHIFMLCCIKSVFF